MTEMLDKSNIILHFRLIFNHFYYDPMANFSSIRPFDTLQWSKVFLGYYIVSVARERDTEKIIKNSKIKARLMILLLKDTEN